MPGAHSGCSADPCRLRARVTNGFLEEVTLEERGNEMLGAGFSPAHRRVTRFAPGDKCSRDRGHLQLNASAGLAVWGSQTSKKQFHPSSTLQIRLSTPVQSTVPGAGNMQLNRVTGPPNPTVLTASCQQAIQKEV